jgi:hypothetical protein
MPLTANLQASFGQNGFDLSASFTGLSDLLGSVGLPELSFSGDDAGVDLSSLSVEGVVTALTSVLDDLGGVTGALPDIDSVLGPLRSALSLVDVIGSGDLPSLVGSFGDALAPTDFGLPALLDAAGRIGDVPAVRTVVDLVGPLGLDLRSPGALIGGPAGGLVSLIQLLGALLGVETASREIQERAELVLRVLQGERIASLSADTGQGVGARLAGLISGIDPNDAHLVELVAPPIENYFANVRELLTLLVRGLAFAEATTVDADFPALVAGLELASVALSTSALAPIDELVATLRGYAAPFLSIEVPDLGGADAVWGATASLASQLEAAVAGIQPSALHQVIDPILDPVLAPVRAVRTALDELASVLATVLDPVRQALEAVNIDSIRDAIHTVIAPIQTAVGTVTDLINGATAEVQGVVGTIDGLLAPVRDGLNTAKDVIAEPFEAVSDVLGALNLEELNERARATLTSVADALGSVPIQPVFDVATGIISTAADALGLVPKALLPDDLKSALEAACAPVESLDLEPARQELHTQLQAIIDSLDTSVLDALEQGYAELKEFIASIDPGPLLESLETEAFNQLVDALNQLDPSVVLEPVTEALDTVREALAGIDFDSLFKPANDALDTVVETLEQVSPNQLLQPVEDLLAGVQEQVESALGLSTWDDRLTAAEETVTGLVTRFDPTPTFAALNEAWVDLVNTMRPRPGGTGLAASLLGGALGGLPFKVNAGGIGEVIAWIRGERDGATVVRERLAAASAALERAKATLDGIDARSLTVNLDTNHRDLAAAINAHPEDSVLRVRLDVSVAASAPTAALALILTNVDRVKDAVSAARTAVGLTTGADRSEVTLVSLGLAASFAPLAPVGTKARSLIAAVGANPDTPDVRDALADLLISVGPESVLGPIEAVASSLVNRMVELIRDGLFAPLKTGVGDLQSVLGSLNVDTLTGGLGTLHQQLVDTVNNLRPAVALAEPLGLFNDVRETLDAFDPFAPVQAAIDALRALITNFVDQFKPSVLLAPVLTAYDQLAGLIGGFDLASLLEPIISRLQAIGGDIDRGLDGVIDALGRLKEACESDGGPIPGLDLSVAASVDVGGAFGL